LKNDLFTFSIQAAETLGIECAIVLAATKDLKNPSVIPNEMVVLIKDQIPFLYLQKKARNQKKPQLRKIYTS